MKEKHYSTRKIALLGMLTALIYVSRVSLAFLPNVQPMTTILIVITLAMSVKDGLIVAILSLIVTNISMGFGVWTLAQIVSFTIVIFVMSAFRKIYTKVPVIIMAMVCGLMGVLYGLIISLVQAPFFGWISFFPYYISGIPYDMFHAIGNFCFYIILAPTIDKLIKNSLKRYYVQ